MQAFYMLLVFMVAAGIVAVEIKDLLAAVISLGAVGFGVAIMFIMLQAPDLAFVQIVIEILAVVFFVAVILKTTHEDETLGRGYTKDDIIPILGFSLFALMFLYLGIKAMISLPSFGNPLMKVASYYIENGLKEVGAGNLVAAVILDYRGYDTLGEATVLFTSVIGVLAILRKEGRKK